MRRQNIDLHRTTVLLTLTYADSQVLDGDKRNIANTTFLVNDAKVVPNTTAYNATAYKVAAERDQGLKALEVTLWASNGGSGNKNYKLELWGKVFPYGRDIADSSNKGWVRLKEESTVTVNSETFAKVHLFDLAAVGMYDQLLLIADHGTSDGATLKSLVVRGVYE